MDDKICKTCVKNGKTKTGGITSSVCEVQKRHHC